MEIIPAIDIIDGKCVRLRQGDYNEKTVYNENPLEVARQYEDNGICRLHLVDLDGAKAKRIINYKVLETIASRTNLIIDFGGGLKKDEDLRIAFESGATMVTGGSIAVKDPDVFEKWIQCYGDDKIILGADVKEEKIAVSGWQEDTSINIFDFLEDYLSKGISKVICTDISKDGMLKGISIDLYKKITDKFNDIQLIASGGVKSMNDVELAAENNLYGIIIGKAIYEGKITLNQLQHFIVNQ